MKTYGSEGLTNPCSPNLSQNLDFAFNLFNFEIFFVQARCQSDRVRVMPR